MPHYWDYEEALEFCICAALRCQADIPPFGFGPSPNFPLDNPTSL